MLNAYNTVCLLGTEKTGGGNVTTAKQDRTVETGAHGRLERAYLVAVDSEEQESLWSVEDSLSELGALARTAGAEVIGTMIQRLRHRRSSVRLRWQRHRHASFAEDSSARWLMKSSQCHGPV